MATRMKILEKMIEDKTRECLEELSIIVEEKGIILLSVRRERIPKEQQWWKKTPSDQLINKNLDNS